MFWIICDSQVSGLLLIGMCMRVCVCLHKLYKALLVVPRAVETSLPCGLFVIFWVAALLTIGIHVFALLGWPSCVFCSERSVWGPHESLSLALLSMLTLTSSVRWALWIVLTRRWMQSCVRGWWRPLVFIRSFAAFSLRITDGLAISLHALAVKKKAHLQHKSTNYKVYFCFQLEHAYAVFDV